VFSPRDSRAALTSPPSNARAENMVKMSESGSPISAKKFLAKAIAWTSEM
jgi:hypothetical protein